MKKFPYLTFFGTWALVFCGTFGASMCVVTAYRLPYHLAAMVATALIISGFMTLLFTMPDLGAYLLVPFGVTVLLISLFRWKKLYSGGVVAIRTIQTVLSRTFSFISAPGNLPEGTADYAYFIGFFVGAVMVAMALLISWGLVSGESMFLPFIVPLPLVALSLIYSDLPPAGWAGVLVCVYYGGVMFTGGLRLHHGGGVGRVSLLAVAAMLIMLLLLIKALPPEEFEPLSTQERVEQIIQRAADSWEKMKRLLDKDIQQREDLSREGEFKSTGAHVMDVKTSRPGFVYLRGISYGRYDGHYWTMTGEYADVESLFMLGGSLDETRERMEIRKASSSLLYTPYAVVRGSARDQVRENYISSNDKPASYNWVYRPVNAHLTPRKGNSVEQEYTAWVQKNYVTLSRSQRQAFLDFLKPYELPDTDDPYALGKAIAAILRGVAEYDLSPGQTPKDQDFALYFLTVSKRGYCVHYASALTALLQAKGVPARFVAGFALNVSEADTWVKVTDRSAHAWTEVYVAGWGWVPIEATDGDDPRLSIPALEADPDQDPDQETPEPTPKPKETMAPGPEDTPEPTPEPTPTPTPTPTPEDTPDPEPVGSHVTPTPPPESDPDPETGEEDERSQQPWILWLLGLFLLTILVLLYICLRKQVCKNRMRRMLQGDGRKAVLYGYGELNRLIRHGAAPNETARSLADEAAFSHHVLGQEHMRAMAGFVKAARRELEKKLPWYKLWYLRYLLWLW